MTTTKYSTVTFLILIVAMKCSAQDPGKEMKSLCEKIKQYSNQEKFEQAKNFLEEIELKKLAEQNAKSSKPIVFLGLWADEKSVPGIDVSELGKVKYEVVYLVVADDVVRNEKELNLRKYSFEFVRNYNLLLYHFLELKNKVPPTKIPLEIMPECLGIPNKSWEKSDLLVQLAIRKMLMDCLGNDGIDQIQNEYRLRRGEKNRKGDDIKKGDR